jgi:hypothetical protein
MTELKVFCSHTHGSGHRVGTVTTDSEGLLIKYSAMTWHLDKVVFPSDVGPDGMPRHQAEDRLDPDEATAFLAYCRKCNKPVEINSQRLFAAVQAGKDGIRAPFAAGYAEGLKRSRQDRRTSTD